jgi:hypothetical protein
MRCIYKSSEERSSLYESHVGLRLRRSTREALREMEGGVAGWRFLVMISVGVAVCVSLAMVLF